MLHRVLNMPEYDWISWHIPKKLSAEYTIILNVSNEIHSIKGHCTNTVNRSTEQLSRQRRIQNTVKRLRWSVLQKEQCLSAGAQPEIFQAKGREVWKGKRKGGSAEKHFGVFLLDALKTTFWMKKLTSKNQDTFFDFQKGQRKPPLSP